MAIPPETSFSSLLRADSEAPLQDDEAQSNVLYRPPIFCTPGCPYFASTIATICRSFGVRSSGGIWIRRGHKRATKCHHLRRCCSYLLRFQPTYRPPIFCTPGCPHFASTIATICRSFGVPQPSASSPSLSPTVRVAPRPLPSQAPPQPRPQPRWTAPGPSSCSPRGCAAHPAPASAPYRTLLRSAPRARGAACRGSLPGARLAYHLSASRAFVPGRLFASPSCPPRRAACAWAHWARCVVLRWISALPARGTGGGRVTPLGAPAGCLCRRLPSPAHVRRPFLLFQRPRPGPMRPAARCSGRSALPRAFERRRRGAAAPPGGSARRGGAAAARASEPALARCSLLTPPPPQPSASSQSLSPTVRVAPRPPFPRKRRLSQPWPVRLARLPGLLRVPGGLLPSSGRGVHSARPQTSHLAGSLRARSPARPVRQPLHPRLRRLHCPSRPRPSRRSSSIPALRPPRRASSASLCTCASRASTTPRRARSPGGAGADGRLASAAEGPPGSGLPFPPGLRPPGAGCVRHSHPAVSSRHVPARAAAPVAAVHPNGWRRARHRQGEALLLAHPPAAPFTARRCSPSPPFLAGAGHGRSHRRGSCRGQTPTARRSSPSSLATSAARSRARTCPCPLPAQEAFARRQRPPLRQRRRRAGPASTTPPSWATGGWMVSCPACWRAPRPCSPNT